MVDIRSAVGYSKASSHLHHSLPSTHVFWAEICSNQAQLDEARLYHIPVAKYRVPKHFFLYYIKTMCKTKHNTRDVPWSFSYNSVVIDHFHVPSNIHDSFLLLHILDLREHCANCSFRVITIRLNNISVQKHVVRRVHVVLVAVIFRWISTIFQVRFPVSSSPLHQQSKYIKITHMRTMGLTTISSAPW